jgi:serine/alanine adding enzyme
MEIKLLDSNSDVHDVCSRISSFSNYNVFQSSFYFDILSFNNKTTPYVLIAEDSGVLKGFILIQVQNYFSRLLKSFATRAVISGAPLFNDDEIILSFMLEKYNSIFMNKLVYTQIRNMFNVDKYNHIFEKHNFNRIEHLNYTIDLNNDIDKIWNNVYSKRKNEIRKGIKEGIKVREIDYKDELKAAYDIVNKIYKKAKLPLPEYAYFQNALEIQSNQSIFHILGGFYDSKLIGVMFLLCFEGRVYNWYAAAIPDYYKKYPNDVITWEAIKWASENGYKVFDFGGAGNPAKEYGVRDFKKKYGGLEVNYGRFESIHKPAIMKVSEYGFKLWQKLK